VSETFIRIGTTYIPVSDVELSCEWYESKLGAKCSYQDRDKAILNFANQSFFLVRSLNNQSSNFIDCYGEEHFSITFEVGGLSVLETIHKSFIDNGIKVGEVENRGHAGRNFVFYDVDGNKFDVWSELSPTFIEKYLEGNYE